MNIKPGGLILLSLLVGCDKPQPTAAIIRPALVRVVGAKAPAEEMILVGEVLPRYESRQGFRIAGKITVRTVEVGTPVKKGQVLARLDSTDTHLSTLAAQADVRAAQANFALAIAEIKRQRQLFAKRFISASALDSREAELKIAQARLAQEQAKANVAGNQTQYAQLTADRDGVITLIHAEPGQVVEVGETVVQIADPKHKDVLVAVPESLLAGVKLQATVNIKLWANPQTRYQGTVREIAPAADPATRTFTVRITINDADEAVKLGMTAGVKLIQTNIQTATEFLIPASALTEINGKKIVWVIDEHHQAQPRPVISGPFREDGVLISNGLKAGETIAIAGVHTLTENQLVKPILEAAP